LRALGISLDLDEILTASKIGALTKLFRIFSYMIKIEKNNLKMLCSPEAQSASFDINH
jgi:hypothetical protein